MPSILPQLWSSHSYSISPAQVSVPGGWQVSYCLLNENVLTVQDLPLGSRSTPLSGSTNHLCSDSYLYSYKFMAKSLRISILLTCDSAVLGQTTTLLYFSSRCFLPFALIMTRNCPSHLRKSSKLDLLSDQDLGTGSHPRVCQATDPFLPPL